MKNRYKITIPKPVFRNYPICRVLLNGNREVMTVPYSQELSRLLGIKNRRYK